MKIFITGSTGFVGENLVSRLANEGHIVHALYRSGKKIPGNYSPNIIYFKGDIIDEASLEQAMDGCEAVIHTAAFTGKWHSDPGEIFKLNVESTLSVINIAIRLRIKKCLITSSAAVFGPSNGVVITEACSERANFFTPYEESKALMEREAQKISSNGLDIIFVNPTRIYGPGPLNDANSVTRLIRLFREGKWHFIPGNGKSIGNYVFIDDVVEGHILALEKGRNGERYLLGGENITYTGFFSLLGDLCGKRPWMVKLPLPLMLAAAGSMALWSRLTGMPPMITPGLVKKYNHHWESSSEKAIRELGYHPISLREGIQKTLHWLDNIYPQ